MFAMHPPEGMGKQVWPMASRDDNTLLSVALYAPVQGNIPFGLFTARMMDPGPQGSHDRIIEAH